MSGEYGSADAMRWDILWQLADGPQSTNALRDALRRQGHLPDTLDGERLQRRLGAMRKAGDVGLRRQAPMLGQRSQVWHLPGWRFGA
jgi:hypothetical protein